MPRRSRHETERTLALLDVFQVAEILGIHERTFRHMVAGGAAPAPIKVGIQSRWQRSVIESWINAGCPRVARERHAWDVPEKRGRGRPRKTSTAPAPAAASTVPPLVIHETNLGQVAEPATATTCTT